MSLLIRDGYVVTMNPGRDVLPGGFVLVGDDGRIERVGPAHEAPTAFGGEVVDARGMLVVPGLVNAHHLPWQHLLMGLPPQAATPQALARCAALLDAGDLRVAAALAAAEMLDGGTTCVLHHVPAQADDEALDAGLKAIAESGLRQVAALDYRARREPRLQAAAARWHGAHDGRVRLAVHVAVDAGSVAAGLVGEGDIAQAYAFALRHGQRLSSSAWSRDSGLTWDDARHETGRSSVMHLMELGVLDSHWMLAHAETLNAADVRLMRESGCHAVATPVADAMRGHGSLVWTELLRAGVPLALGSDGPALTCTVDMVEQMKALVLIQNTVSLDPTSMSAEAVLEMATLGGARALGLDHEIGSLEPGKRADVAVFDMRGPHFQVSHKPISTFVCCARGADAHLVLVDGRVVRRAGARGDAAAQQRLAREGLARGDALQARAQGEALARDRVAAWAG